jgi:hypothetical protein
MAWKRGHQVRLSGPSAGRYLSQCFQKKFREGVSGFASFLVYRGRDPIHLRQLQPLAAVVEWEQRMRLRSS